MRKAYREVTFRKQERIEADDELAGIPEELTEEYEMLKDAPVTLKLERDRKSRCYRTAGCAGSYTEAHDA